MANQKAILTNPWLLGGVIAAVTLAAYIPAMNAGFLSDDAWLLYESPHIKAPDGLYRFWFTTKAPDYFPLTWSTLWVEWRLWGTSPAGYHVTNIVLHAAAAVLVWRLLAYLGVPGAWLAALIFAVHPVNVESVAWISERKNVLAMVFYVPAAMAYFRSQRGARKGWYAASLVFFALALLSKTAVVTLPVALLVLTWYRRGRLEWKDLAVVAPMLLMSLVLGIVTIVFDMQQMGDTIIRPEGLADRLAASGWIVWFYLYKAFVPVGLSLRYTRWTVDGGAVVSYMPLALLVGCFAGLWLARRAGWARAALVALACFVIVLFPVLGFIDDPYWTYSLVADRHQYFVIIAVIALAVAGCAKLAAPAAATLRGARIPVAVGVLAALTALTWHRAGLFADNEALWRDTMTKNPDAWVPRSSLMAIFQRQGRADEMIALCHDTLAWGVHQHKVLNELAWVYATWPDENVRNGEQAVHLAGLARELTGGKSPIVLDTLAAALAETGQFDEAVRVAARAVQLAEQAVSDRTTDRDKKLIDQYRSRLKLYREKRPYRHAALTAPGADTPMKE